jgi:transcription elongation factor Elf1
MLAGKILECPICNSDNLYPVKTKANLKKCGNKYRMKCFNCGMSGPQGYLSIITNSYLAKYSYPKRDSK